MKKFEEPILTVDEFEVEDVITTSTCEQEVPDLCPAEGGEYSLR